MSLSFKKGLLVEDLAKCMPGISTGQVTLEGADSFVFKDGYVHTYNSAISVSEKLSQNLPDGVVNAVDLYSALLKFPEDDCELETVETKTGQGWLIKCGKIKLTVNLLKSDNIMERFTNITPDEKNWISLDGQEFQNLIKLCSIPSNKSKYSGIIFKDNSIISTDGWQVNVATSKTQFPYTWINNDAAKSIMSWNSFTGVQLNHTWLQFKTEDSIIFSVKVLFTESLPIDLILSSITKTESLENLGNGTFSTTFFDAVDRASNFSQKVEDYSTVDLIFDTEGITVKSHKSSGAYEEYVDDVKCPVKVETHIDPAMLLSTKGKFNEFSIYRTPVIPGKTPSVRFKFKTDNFLSIISSMN